MVVSVAKEAEHRVVEDLPLYEAVDLTKGGDLARIRLHGQLYTLRITRAGKLILTK